MPIAYQYLSARFEGVSDEDLARQSQAGRLDAFEELVRRYERRVYGFALRCNGSPADASEVTQDTFVKAYQALAGFDPRRDFATWLFTIARRKLIDRHRTARPAQSELPEQVEPDNPAELLARREDNSQIWDTARRCLSPDQFQALWLRYVEDMNIREVARVLRKTATHVKVLLFRARKALVRQLGHAPVHPRVPTAIPSPPLGLALPGPEQPL